MEFSSFEDLWRIQSNAQGPPKPYISSLSRIADSYCKERLRVEILGNRPDGTVYAPGKGLGRARGCTIKRVTSLLLTRVFRSNEGTRSKVKT